MMRPPPTPDCMTKPEGDEQLQSLVTLNRALLTQHLLRGIAHDLRNHLQVLALGLSVEGGSPPSLAARLDQAIQSMSTGLDRLARLGRLEDEPSGGSDLGEVIAETLVLAGFQRSLPDRRIESHGDAGRGVQVRLPGAIAVQLLLNLVANAKMAAPAGTPVGIAVQAGSRGMVDVIVEDEGPGPTAPDALWVTPHDRNLHAGVGLTAVRHLAARYGGLLRWERTAATRAILTLPTIARG